jgi:hypothetical protein
MIGTISYLPAYSYAGHRSIEAGQLEVVGMGPLAIELRRRRPHQKSKQDDGWSQAVMADGNVRAWIVR